MSASRPRSPQIETRIAKIALVDIDRCLTNANGGRRDLLDQRTLNSLKQMDFDGVIFVTHRCYYGVTSSDFVKDEGSFYLNALKMYGAAEYTQHFGKKFPFQFLTHSIVKNFEKATCIPVIAVSTLDDLSKAAKAMNDPLKECGFGFPHFLRVFDETIVLHNREQKAEAFSLPEFQPPFKDFFDEKDFDVFEKLGKTKVAQYELAMIKGSHWVKETLGHECVVEFHVLDDKAELSLGIFNIPVEKWPSNVVKVMAYQNEPDAKIFMTLKGSLCRVVEGKNLLRGSSASIMLGLSPDYFGEAKEEGREALVPRELKADDLDLSEEEAALKLLEMEGRLFSTFKKRCAMFREQAQLEFEGFEDDTPDECSSPSIPLTPPVLQRGKTI